MSTTTLTAARDDAASTGDDVGHAPSEQSAAVVLPSAHQRSSERRRAQLLVQATDGDRQQLEALRGEYLRRLHLASDDFEATEGLRVVEPALTTAQRPEGVWVWQRRERNRGRRWWRRRVRK